MASPLGSNKGTPEIRRRHCLSLQDKLRLLRELDEGEGRKTNLAHKFGISKSTLSSIIATRSKIENAFRMAKFSPNRKRLRMGKYSRLEDQLLAWYKKELESGSEVADALLENKAREFARHMNLDDFCASTGWLHRFKERKGLGHWAKSCGVKEEESTDAQLKEKHVYNLPVRTSLKYSDASVAEADSCLAEFTSWTDSTNWTEAVLPDLLRTYTPSNIYSVTETGLYFKCLPFGMNSLRGQTCAGGDHALERLTVVTAANLDGSSKLPLFCVGKERNPKCFRGVKHFPVTYKCSYNAWMTPEFFCSWIKELDTFFTKEGKKVAILVDTSPAHMKPPYLKSVELIFLPPHTSRCMQSQNKGIVYFLKWKYRELMLKRMILHFETHESAKPFQWSVLDALHDLKRAWDRLPPNIVHNCFTETGFSIPQSDKTTSEVSSDHMLQRQIYRSLYQRVSLHIPVDMSMEDYITVDKRVVTWDQMGMVSKIISNTCYNTGFIRSKQNGLTCDDSLIMRKPFPESMEVSPSLEAITSASEEVKPDNQLSRLPNGAAFMISTPGHVAMLNNSLHENGTNCNDNQPDSDVQSCGQVSPSTPNCVSLQTSISTSPILSSATPMEENGSNCNPSNDVDITFNTSMTSDTSALAFVLNSGYAESNGNSNVKNCVSETLAVSTGATTGCVAEEKEKPSLFHRSHNCTITVDVKEPEETVPPPSLREAHNALLLLRRLVESTATSRNEAVDMFGCLNQLEDFIEKQVIIAPRQTSILDFFNRL
ncbi:tigger transposable element-derived protein 4 [Biomphalaria glabrata]|nr:tigger transposable element-derived protein 4 [Biomphalaria glabrata]